MQLKKKKWVGLLIMFLLAALLSAVVDSTPIAHRAIVAGLAIDLVDNEIEATAQILVASGQGSKAQAKQVSAKNETLSGAFNDISKKTSMAVSLAHCNLVVLGGEVLKGNAYRVLDYLIRNAYLSENAMLIGTLGTGKDILNTKVAFSEQASFFAQRTLFSFGTYQGIAKRTIKNFVVDYNKPGSANYLPLITKTKEPMSNNGKESAEGGDSENAEPKTTATEDSGGAGGASSSTGGEGEEYLFDMTKTAVIKKESLALILDEDGTAGLNYVLNEVKRGALTVPVNEKDLLELYVIDKKIKKTYSLQKMQSEFEVTLSVIYKEELKETADKNYHRTVRLSKEEESRAAEIVASKIYKVYNDARAVGIDIFEVSDNIRRKYNADYTGDQNFLDAMSLNVTVKFQYN